MDWRAKVELYEQIRREYEFGVGSVIGVARKLGVGMPKIVKLLNSNLKEELAAAKKITAASVPIMKLSAKEPKAPKVPKTGKEQYSAKKSKEDEQEAAPDLPKSSSEV